VGWGYRGLLPKRHPSLGDVSACQLLRTNQLGFWLGLLWQLLTFLTVSDLCHLRSRALSMQRLTSVRCSAAVNALAVFVG
jgi:hypothetical protein